MESSHHRPRWKTLLAFGIIYFVWGSTFFAIRVGVSEVPPFLFAAMRFLAAGLLVYLGHRAGRARTNRPPVDLGISAGVSHLRRRLRAAVLGGAARAFGHRGGDTGDDSCVHGAV